MPQIESMALPPRLPLIISTANRGRTFTKDSRLVNCYIETDKQQQLWVYKRPGLAEYSTSSPGEAMGAYHWRGDVFWIWDGTLFRNGISVPGTLDVTNGTYRWSSILGANPKLIFGNAVETYTYGESPSTLTALSSSTIGGTLPANTYYYVVTAMLLAGESGASNEAFVVTTGATSSNTIEWDPVVSAIGYRIYRGTAPGLENVFYSVGAVLTFLDTGAAGTAGSPPVPGISTAYISADLHSIDPDFPIDTVKGIVYLDGFTFVMDIHGQIWGSVVNSVDKDGDWSAINFIAAQSEPDGGVYLAKQFVYVIAMGQWSTEVFFNAGNPTASPLGRVDGSKLSFGCATAESVQEIDDRLFWISSTKSAATQVSSLDQLNHAIVSTDAVDRLIQSSSLADSMVASTQLKIDGHSFYILTLRDINLTLAYDINEDEWQQWTDQNGNYFKMMAYTYTAPPKKHIMQHESNGNTYLCDPAYKNDFGFPIVVDIYTPLFDASTTRRKQMNVMTFVGDQDVGSILQVRSSDDDYRTWCNFRKVDLNQHDPMLITEGTFTRRAYHFRHAANTAFRMQAVEVQYDIGTL